MFCCVVHVKGGSVGSNMCDGRQIVHRIVDSHAIDWQVLSCGRYPEQVLKLQNNKQADVYTNLTMYEIIRQHNNKELCRPE